MNKFALALFSAVAFGALSGCSDKGTNDLAGTWKVSDTGGQPFEITLKADGSAQASRAGEGMKGTWQEDGGGAVIKWDTGWTTKIVKEGASYKKMAYEKEVTGTPKNTSAAEKIK